MESPVFADIALLAKECLGGFMSVGSFNWFAVYTKPQQEQIALLNLERQSFECYLPMVDDSVLHPKARKKTRKEPLFLRYLFLGATPKKQSLAAVRSTRGVAGLVSAGLELSKIPTSIIAGLKTRMHPGRLSGQETFNN